MSEVNTIPSTAPKSVVTFSVLIDGQKISDSYKVMSIVVRKEVNTISKATLLLQDGSAAEQTFTTSNAADLVPGMTIEILAGYQNEEETIFKGITIKHSLKVRKDVSMLAVECRHLAVKMTTKLNNNYFRDMTDDEVVEQLCREYQLQLDSDSAAITHPQLVQFNCTDWDFTVCRAEENGFWVVPKDDDSLSFKPPDFDQDPVLTLAYGATIKEMEAEIDARCQYESVKSVGWDPASQEPIEAEADNPTVPAAGNIAATDLAGSTSNTAWDIRHTALAEDELRVWASSTLQKQRLAKIRGYVKIDGTHLPQPAQMLALENVGDRFEGKLMATAVRHTIEEGNWETHVQFGSNPEYHAERFSLEQPKAAGLVPAVEGLQIGVVTSLEDPDGEERIQVRLPLVHSSDEGAWMRLCTLDAGKERGWTFRPEINDEVIVGFLQSDPRFGVILGKLHSSKHNSPIEASNDNHEKGYQSREQLLLLFNDEKKSITLETPGGHKLVLNDDDTSVSIEDSNGNMIVMNSDGIEIKSDKDIKLNAGVNLKMESSSAAELKGGSTAKVEGSTGAEFSSGGTTAVKGSAIQLN